MKKFDLLEHEQQQNRRNGGNIEPYATTDPQHECYHRSDGWLPFKAASAIKETLACW